MPVIPSPSVRSILAGVTSFALFACVSLVSHAQDVSETTTRGSVDHVTVYKGKALVSRTIDIPEKDRDQQRIVVEGLPAETDPDSLYAEGADDVTIRSVRYRARPVEKDVRTEVRNLDEKIKEKKREIERTKQKQQTISHQKDLLKKLQNFTAPSADWELGHGVLDAETIESLTDFFFQKQETLDRQMQELEFQKADLEESLDQLNRERHTLTSSSSRTRREAIVSLSGGQGNSFELRYLVENADWSPSYNLRATEERDQVQLEYLASVQQMSGEDWNNVNMTLSTASPSLVSEPPTLGKLPIQLQAEQTGGGAGGGGFGANRAAQSEQYQEKLQELQKRQAQLQQKRSVEKEKERSGASSGQDFIGGQLYTRKEVSQSFDDKLNHLSSELQLLELSSGTAQNRKESTAKTKRNQQQASVRYELSGKTSLPSRDDKQLIRITSQKIDASFYRIARPVLTDKVYEQAKLQNEFDWVLLSGPSNSYLGGQFVGRGTVPTVSVGESFKAGFGIDSDLRAGRELVDREVQTQGGNKIVNVTYQLTLSNFSEKEKTVRLFDRLPVPDRNGDVRITFLNADQDPVKKPTDDENRVKPGSDGIVRWDVTVPSKSVGDEQFSLNYSYSLEYAKNRRITK